MNEWLTNSRVAERSKKNMKAAMRNLQEQFMQRNIKTEFSKFEKYKDAIPHGGCVL